MASWGEIAQKTRVPAGTVLGVIFLLLMHPSTRSLWIGGSVAASGSLLRIWAAGHIDKGMTLARNGPYALTRNPLYLGSLLMAVGILVAGQAYWLLIPFGAFFLAFYYPVMKREEQELFQGYGVQFLRYAESVPLFFPGSWTKGSGTSTFLWARVLKNREHRTVIGLLLIQAFLIWRALQG